MADQGRILREQERARPLTVPALEEYPLVQPGGIARPEFDRLWDDAKAAPERWTRYRRAFKTIANLADALIEHGPGIECGALRRRPGANLTFARSRGEVPIGFSG